MHKPMISVNRASLDSFESQYINKSYTLDLDNITRKSSGLQPIIGIVDTGFSANHPNLDYSRIQLGYDYIDNDHNPLTADENSYEHGTQILNIIGATQSNGIGIDGLNDDAPLWLSRAVGSGKWAESLVEFVDTAKASGQPNAVVNLSFDLVQANPDGSLTTRYELTSSERTALEYARQNHVLVVSAAGNQGGAMSALGQAAQEFDNLIVVGAADGLDRADSSSYGNGLTLLAENDGAGTSTATAQVTGAVSQIWAANPELNYHQVIDVLEVTAIDLNTPGWDEETGFGVLNLDSAMEMAVQTNPVQENISDKITPLTLENLTFDETTLERPTAWWNPIDWIPTPPNPLDLFRDWYDTLTGFGKELVNTLTDAGKELVKGIKWLTEDGYEWAFDKFGDGVEWGFDQVGLDSAGEFLNEQVFDRVGEKLQGVLEREIQWLEQFPDRIERLGSDFFSDFWNDENFWKGLGNWVGQNYINILEISGIPEVAETIADLIKFNTRPLNSKELEIAKSVFGNSIDYDIVRIDEGSFGNLVNGDRLFVDSNRPFVTFNTINSWGSLDEATLIHELTHVWQYQQDGAIYLPEAIAAQSSSSLWNTGIYPDGINRPSEDSKGYDYGGFTKLQERQNNGQTLTSFNREQQANIVEHFFTIREDGNRDNDQHLSLYAHFVDEVSTLSQTQLLAPFIIGGDEDDTLRGNTASNHLLGGDGDDYLHGDDGTDTLDGGSGDDFLVGWNGSDTMYGGDHNDTLWAGNGDDKAYGGNGDDQLAGWNGNDYLDGENGNDIVYGDYGDDTVHGGDGTDTLYGGEGNDELSGDVGNDLIYGEDGDDILYDYDGNNTLDGGNGNDLIVSGNNADQLDGGDGNDSIYSLDGDDTIDGGSGSDVIYGYAGNDTINGREGDDTIEGGDGSDTIEGGNNDDEIHGDNGNDVVYGGTGDDLLDGENDSDELIGEEGDDELIGGNGNDTLTGSNPSQWNSGFEEIDILTGGAGGDTFVLGDSFEAFYNGDGTEGLAAITDFDSTEGDQFVVHGSFSDYSLSSLDNGNVAILFQEDLIAFVENTTDVVLSRDFTFV